MANPKANIIEPEAKVVNRIATHLNWLSMCLNFEPTETRPKEAKELRNGRVKPN